VRKCVPLDYLTGTFVPSAPFETLGARKTPGCTAPRLTQRVFPMET